MIDQSNPPKNVIMPFELANLAYSTLAQMPYARVRELMARLENETEPAPAQKPQLMEVPKPSEVEHVLQNAP